MGAGARVIASIIVLVSLVAVPWVGVSYKSYLGSESMDMGYPELAVVSENYIREHVSKELTKGTPSSELTDEDGNYTPLARTYLLIAEGLAVLPLFVLIGALVGLGSRWGHVLGLIGMLAITFALLSMTGDELSKITMNVGYILGWAGFITGAAFGGEKKPSS